MTIRCRDRCRPDCVVVGFTTTCGILKTKVVSSNPTPDDVYTDTPLCDKVCQ